MAPSDQEPSSGRFGYERWWLDVGADDRAAEYASAHESHHKQLTDSTSFGVLARVSRELAEKTSEDRYLELAHQLMRAAAPVQEAFACWAPLVALRWTPEELAAIYPAYVRHWQAMEGVVGEVPSPYLRLHAAHAVARVCMQASVDEAATAVGLDRLRLSDLRRRDHPDHRFAQLRKHPPQWSAVISRLEERFESERRWRDLVDAKTLQTQLFAVELRGLWNDINRSIYDEVAIQLAASGSATLPHDGQLTANARLTAEAQRALGNAGQLGIAPREQVSAAEVPRVILANIEAEDFAVSEALSAQLLQPGTPPQAMVADLEHPHLFLTIRPNAALLANYALDLAEPPTGIGAYLRRSVRALDDTISVELLMIDGPGRLAGIDIPIFAAVPLSLLTREMRERWGDVLAPARAAALLDVALAPLLKIWLAQPNTHFRYAFIRTQPAGRVLPLLVGVVDVGGEATTHLLVKPLSPPAVRKMKTAFEELDPDGIRLVPDPHVLTAFEPLAQVVLAHLALEEVRFALAG